MKFLKNLFIIEKKPHKGLIMAEWAMVAYVVFTLLLMLFTYTRLQNPVSMLWLRFQSVMMMAALWAVYRMIPCRMTMCIRVIAQLTLLSSWYPETFEFNRILPNLDHHFAAFEQQLFGCQPALLFSERFPSPVVSELLTMGYVSYYPMMAILLLYYFFHQYEHSLKASFLVIGSFFVFYVIFIFLPVSGPQYYYMAVGTDQIAQGIFPNIGNYFETHTEGLPVPGWKDGIFYKLLIFAHEVGERPTAAFPSSHVGATIVFLILAWTSKNRKLFWSFVPFAVLMFFATFYLQAHYAIDAIAGIFAGTAIYFLLLGLYKVIRKK
ncbi:MAG: phosphatase PAP2 family protein [Prevotella sp.]|nr:phosphatase PAP2 family protein [Prevotella sp.]